MLEESGYLLSDMGLNDRLMFFVFFYIDIVIDMIFFYVISLSMYQVLVLGFFIGEVDDFILELLLFYFVLIQLDFCINGFDWLDFDMFDFDFSFD